MTGRRIAILTLTLLASIGFFFEYWFPHKPLFVTYDLQTYHYPLMDRAFQELTSGRLPGWNPTMYCGLPLAGNVQSALFYPPTWILFLASWPWGRLRFDFLEYFVFLHVWLASILTAWWLRNRGLSLFPSLIGAIVYAYGGYMMTQLQHLGLVIGVAWWPLAFLGVDRCAASRSWRPDWRIVCASALVFVGGYPPLWIAFAYILVCYAVGSGLEWKLAAATILSLAISLLLAAVQFFPMLEVSRLLESEWRYGSMDEVGEFLTFAIPNFFDFGLHVPVATNPGYDYWYLGCAGLAGIGLAIFSRSGYNRNHVLALAVGLGTLIILADPFKVLSSFTRNQPILSSAVRSWYFIPGFLVTASLLAASGFQRVAAPRPPDPRNWLPVLGVTAAAVWSIRLLAAPDFASGWHSVLDAAIGLAAVGLLTYSWTRSTGARRQLLAATILILALVELKAFGTSRRFNTSKDGPDAMVNLTLPGLDPNVHRRIQRDRGFRIAVSHDGGPAPVTLQHYELASPQGFDPLLTRGYKTLIGRLGGTFVSDRAFRLAPSSVQALRFLGVKYFLAPDGSAELAQLRLLTKAYRELDSVSYFKTFELIDASPAYAWAKAGAGASASIVEWRPGFREFQVASASGGRFRLAEQFFPGWTRQSTERLSLWRSATMRFNAWMFPRARGELCSRTGL